MSAAFFVPNGHLCVENGQQPGIEEGLHMIKKDFMETDWGKEDLWKYSTALCWMSQFS